VDRHLHGTGQNAYGEVNCSLFVPRPLLARTLAGYVALLIRGRNFSGTALRRSNWTDLSRQVVKLVRE